MGVSLPHRRSVVVFDEGKRFPPAREFIKQLVADGRYDYIETGSLISIRRNVEDIVIPSEETALRLEPLGFEEILWLRRSRPGRFLYGVRSKRSSLCPSPA